MNSSTLLAPTREKEDALCPSDSTIGLVKGISGFLQGQLQWSWHYKDP